MKSKIFLAIVLMMACTLDVKSQWVLFSNTFNSALTPCTVANSSNGGWVWSNSCSMSSSAGHSAPGHAIFQGSGCQFGNGSLLVSGDLMVPTVAIPVAGATLTFNYFISNECTSIFSTCPYDVLTVQISSNNGSTWTNLASNGSNVTPTGMWTTSAWTSFSCSLNSYAGQNIILRFNFNSVDGVGNTYDGIYVDDIFVTAVCPVAISAIGQGSTNITVCSGGNATLTSNGISNYTWSTGANTSTLLIAPTTATVYTLTATTSQCTGTAAVNVNVVTGLPVLSIVSGPNPLCLGASTSFTASGAATYTWSGGVTNGQSFIPPNGQTTYTVIGGNGCGTVSATRITTVNPLTVTALANPTLICQNYPATLTAVSSVGGYTWLPSNSIGGQVVVSTTANTIYTVTASDGTCSGTQTVSLQTKASPTITAGPFTQVCQGTSVTLTATGAGNNGTYSWSPIGNTTNSVVLAATASSVYIVYGTNTNNCTSSAQQIVVVDNAPPVVATADKNMVCTGGMVQLSASGANTYTWTGGPQTSGYTVNPTSNTVYTVMAGHTTNSCVGTATIPIAVIIPSVVYTQSTAVCAGGTATLVASGATTYTWNFIPQGPNGTFVITPANTGSYVLTANTQSGSVNCPETHTATVKVNPNPTVSVVSTKSVTCKLQTNTLTASGASSYTWSHNGSNANPINVNPSVTTVYTVTGADANGCTHIMYFQAKVNSCAGISENTEVSSRLSIYPNPNNGVFTVKAESDQQVSIINEIGQEIATFTLNSSNNYSHQVQNLNPGLYFMSCESNGVRVTEKVVVAK